MRSGLDGEASPQGGDDHEAAGQAAAQGCAKCMAGGPGQHLAIPLEKQLEKQLEKRSERLSVEGHLNLNLFLSLLESLGGAAKEKAPF